MSARALSHKRLSNIKQFLYGSPYYPEHWDAAVRGQDAERMKAAGWNCVRMGEFAWDRMEAEEGRFDFTLFDETIQRLGKVGIKTILCTPTAAPPVCLTRAHPEILRVDERGLRMAHGSRQHACTTGSFFRENSRRITAAMAEHFAGNPDVIGWQTDNELNCQFSECHCASCQAGFREFLAEKYSGNLDALNQAWGTAFWSQTYRSFDEIETPRANLPTHPNPGQKLDYARFISWAVTRFQAEQVAILRQANPDWLIMHNGIFQHIDYRGQFTRDLDVLGYDVYPFFTHNPAERVLNQCFNLDYVRSLSGNFIVPEQQSGPGGQAPYFHDNPEPGEMRRMVYTSISRGADSILFFRWRTARFGAEEYWCGVLDHDNVPRRRLHEAAQLGAELGRVGAEVLGTYVRITAGIAAGDFDANEAHDTLPFNLPGPRQAAQAVWRSLFRRGYPVGCVHPADDLSDLKVYFLPHWEVVDPAWLPNLQAFVERGGLLVIGARSATRGIDNAVTAETLPGVLRGLTGMTVEEYGRQNHPESRPLAIDFAGNRVQTEYWYEVLQPEGDSGVLARWQGRYLSGQPAATLRHLGRGVVVYVGTYLTSQVMAGLWPMLQPLCGLQPLLPHMPPGLEVTLRTDGQKKLWFLVNSTGQEVSAPVPSGMDLVSQRSISGSLILPSNGVAVIKN
jgi:beta-galactosidase